MTPSEHYQLEIYALSLGILSINIEFRLDATLEERKLALKSAADSANRHFMMALKAGLIH
ncbi:MAG: hypothetical protein RLY57_688 [Candidatus Parcubacteria bacterium]|jgi:hypothetical protein